MAGNQGPGMILMQSEGEKRQFNNQLSRQFSGLVAINI
jgi:hypothetical protein